MYSVHPCIVTSRILLSSTLTDVNFSLQDAVEVGSSAAAGMVVKFKHSKGECSTNIITIAVPTTTAKINTIANNNANFNVDINEKLMLTLMKSFDLRNFGLWLPTQPLQQLSEKPAPV